MRIKKNKNYIDEEESYRILINHCYRYAKENIRCIAVSSYTEAQGKTNLVKGLGEKLAQAGYKTLIVDCNVLLPELSKNYTLEQSQGMLEAIEQINKTQGKVTTTELLRCAQPTEIENLYLCSRGGYLQKPYTAYINQRAVHHLFKIFKRNFMFVLIEVPSFNYLSFAQVFIESADGYLMAIKKGTMPIREIPQLKEKMKIINIEPLGAVFNQVSERRRGDKDAASRCDATNNGFSYL